MARKAIKHKTRGNRDVQLSIPFANCRSQIGKSFGGSCKKGNPKTKRPFSPKHLIHLVLKSSYAKGHHSFLHPKNKAMVDGIVKALAKKCGISIRDYVNVGNHIHLLIKTSHRLLLIRFLRAITGILPRKLFKCEKGKPLGFSFWDGRPYTKIVAEGLRPFRNIIKYFEKNRQEARFSVVGFDFFYLNTS